MTARLNGKQVGRKKGVGFETKKAREAKQILRTHCKTFGGTLDDAECMKLIGLARNTYYKYKRQIRAELMAEQDLPKGASIFYEPPKSFCAGEQAHFGGTAGVFEASGPSVP